MTWSTKVEYTGFIRQFFIDEIKIYNHILSKPLQKLDGRPKDLANSFNVSNESFFGFLLGIEPLIKYDLKTLKHRDRIKIGIELNELYRYLRQKPNYEHLLELDGWESVSEKTEDSGITEDISITPKDSNIPGDKRVLWNSWKNRVQNIDFIHEFFVEELVIYHWILSQKKPIFTGSISELAKYFELSEDIFFGFLLGIKPFVKNDLKLLKSSSHIDTVIDLRQLRQHLMTKSDYAHILALEGWTSVEKITQKQNVKENVLDITKEDNQQELLCVDEVESEITATSDDLHGNIISTPLLHLDTLKEHIFSEPMLSYINAKLARDYTRSDYIVFLSLCNAVERATVVKGVGHDLKTAWAKAEKNAHTLIAIKNLDLVWTKADIICSTAEIPVENLNQEMVNSRFPFFLRKGVAFDQNFDLAFLGGEMNGSRLYNYYSAEQLQKKEIDYSSQRLNHSAINNYLTVSYLAPLKNLPETIITFTTIGFFCDEGKVYDLYGGYGIDAGRRAIDETDSSLAMKAITSVSKSINNKVYRDGKFVYAYNPITDTETYTENILRRADSILSLIKGYSITRDETIISGIDAGVKHLVKDGIIYKDLITAFVIDKQTDEIKLGGNGLVITMLIKYMKCFETDCYIDTVRHLANGILELQDKITGSYYHILNSFDFSPKEKSRTIYYDSAATYALAQMYTFTKDKIYLDAAALSVENFIAKNYSKYMDHQVAYSLNEITKYISELRYYEFALQSTLENLNEIIRRPRIYITFLPLLMATWQIYERLIKRNIKVEFLNELDVRRLAETIYKVATHLQSAYFHPEYAMYMKIPKKCVGSVFRREGNFQIKIDDITYFLEGYQMYHSHYENIRSYLSDDFIQSVNSSNLIYPKKALPIKQTASEKMLAPSASAGSEMPFYEADSRVTDKGLIPIGFLYDANFIHPEKDFFETNGYYKTLFYIAAHYGLQLILFSPDDLDFEAGIVQGTILVNGKSEKYTTEIPRVIDNSLRANNRKKDFGKKLETWAYTTRTPGSSKKRKKHDIYNMLLKDGKYTNLLIPTKPVENFEDITSIKSETGIVIKKTNSHQGISVMHISRVKSRYQLILGQERYDFTKSKFKDYYEQNIKGEQYIMQPFIKSATKQGEPFDVRLQARRIDDENFFVNPYVRVGSPKGIISNYAGGGYTLTLDAFLRTNFEIDEQMNIKSQIMQLGYEFPKYYANLLGDARIFDIGLDLGVSKEGGNFKLWLFEVNTYVGGHIYGLGDAKAHCQYLRYLADKLNVR